MQITQLQFQHFTNPHAASGYQFENQSIANFCRAENYLVSGFLFNDFPFQTRSFPIKHTDHGAFAGVSEFGADIVADEIEERRELETTDSLGAGFVSLGEAVQEGEDVFWRDLIDRSITKFPDVPLDDGLVGSHRIIFRMGLVVIDPV